MDPQPLPATDERRPYPVRFPDSDAPDGAVVEDDERGGLWERQADTWVPVPDSTPTSTIAP